MAHSLEIRVPMLDQRMLDLMLAIPGSVRLPGVLANKHLLRLSLCLIFARPCSPERNAGLPCPMAAGCTARCGFMPARPGVIEIAGHPAAGRHRKCLELFSGRTRKPHLVVPAFTLCVLGMYLKKNQAVA